MLSLILIALAAVLPAEPATLRVLQFNVLYGGDPRPELGNGHPLQNKPRHSEIAAVIRETKADVVVVCEMTRAARTRLPELLSEYDLIGDLFIRRTLAAEPIRDVPLPPKHTQDPSGALLRLANGTQLAVFGTHWRPQPDMLERARVESLVAPLTPARVAQLAADDSVLAPAKATLDALRPWLARGAAVLLAGDLNQASHLDWTRRAADSKVARWAGATCPEVPWGGTRHLESGGLVDAYRAVYPNEISHRGDTWTPAYADGTPGRRSFAAQYAARIDYVFIGGPCRAQAAWVVGEPGPYSDVAHEPWVSDHRAVLVEIAVGH
ncbi:MAG: endonuclease/exonuclease/phosphatase family protein [Opitutales bacterium]